MLNNLVNRYDLFDLVDRARHGGLARILRRAAISRRGRIESMWDDFVAGDDQWWAPYPVRCRWHEKVTGNPHTEFRQWFHDVHLRGRLGLHALVVGCGDGRSLPAWARLGAFARIDAFDISPAQVERAREEIARASLDAVVHCDVSAAAALDVAPASYDLVVAEQVLHHLAPLEPLVPRLIQALRPDGLFFVDDYVGPTRWQWRSRQLAAANALLGRLPASHRRTHRGRVKERIVRPSRLRMAMTDPSEASASEAILPTLARHATVVEVRPYGGTLLQLVLAGIAHNFLDSSEATAALLDLCFRTEDGLLADGTLTDDFVVAVCRPP
jgi:SAM-dependent methyltransferase